MKKETSNISKNLIKKIESFGIIEKDYSLIESVSTKNNLYYNLVKLQLNNSLTQNSILNELLQFILKLNLLLEYYNGKNLENIKENNHKLNLQIIKKENDHEENNFINIVFRLFYDISRCKSNQEKLLNINMENRDSITDLIVNLENDEKIRRNYDDLFIIENKIQNLENECEYYKYLNKYEYIVQNNSEEYLTTLIENMNFSDEEKKIINDQINIMVSNEMNNQRREYISLVDEFNKVSNKLENEIKKYNDAIHKTEVNEMKTIEIMSTKEKTNISGFEKHQSSNKLIKSINTKENIRHKDSDVNLNNDNINDINEEYIIDEEKFYEEQIKLLEDKINRSIEMNVEIESEIKGIKEKYKKGKNS